MRGGYAIHSDYRYPANPGTISMHKLIMNPPRGKFVDHINGDKLDNRRSNLRLVTSSQNSMNRKPIRNTKSGYKGVTFNPRNNTWQARIGYMGKRIHLGNRKDVKEAAGLYVEAAKIIQGEYMHSTTLKMLKEGV